MSRKLNSKNFFMQIIKYGFFAEQFPSCFSSIDFANNIEELKRVRLQINTDKKKLISSPETLSTYKNDISRRILSVPNPKIFFLLVKYLSSNWDDLKRVSKSENSLSPITEIYSYDNIEFINCESIKEFFRYKSSFVLGVKECIKCSLGYKYRLKIDITNCYNSIYTHSITWAICTKKEAKSIFTTGKNKSPDYIFGDNIDKLIRYQKNNETNGILVGPFTSRIVSEIILVGIDKLLEEEGYHFRRYVDDYKMYFTSEEEARLQLPKIEKILNEYNLSLNTSKTEIQIFPYEKISKLKSKFSNAIKNGGVIEVINTAAELFSLGEKGAFKYALKTLKKIKIHEYEQEEIIALLMNILLLDPRYEKIIVEFLLYNIEIIDKDKLGKVINRELKKSIKNSLQQETLCFIDLIVELSLSIDVENLIDILNSDNDFAIIQAIDIYKNQNNLIIANIQDSEEKLTSTIEKLIVSLENESILGSRWLLIYELVMNNYCSNKLDKLIEEDDFFKSMKDLKINFYKSPFIIE